jgi:PKD repeat protein
MTVTANDITPPIAEAGPDLLVGEGDLVVLNGSGSRDNVGIVRYVWTFDCGQPEVLEGIGPAYTFNRTGNYIITLRVSDAAGNWGIDTTTVTVVAPTGPVAVAGMDRVIDEGTALQFDGSGSTASPGTIYFNWTFSDGEPVRLYGVNPVYKFNDPGTFIVTLNVTDADGNWDTDTMTVIVKDRTAPSADAGPDLIVNERTSVMFNGSSCSDNVGIVNWTWTFEYGATRIVLSGISPIFNFAVPGVYSIKLNVTDAAGFWTEDTLVITVRDITSPIADAGLDQTVPAGRNILFNGSLSTDNVAISKFFWTFTYGGKAQSLDGENVSFKFDKAGVYEVVLTVIDAAGNRGEDRVTVTVEPTVNLEYGGLLGLLWMLVVLIAVAGIAGYMIMRKRRSRKGGPIQKNGSLPRRLGRDAG